MKRSTYFLLWLEVFIFLCPKLVIVSPPRGEPFHVTLLISALILLVSFFMKLNSVIFRGLTAKFVLLSGAQIATTPMEALTSTHQPDWPRRCQPLGCFYIFSLLIFTLSSTTSNRMKFIVSTYERTIRWIFCMRTLEEHFQIQEGLIETLAICRHLSTISSALQFKHSKPHYVLHRSHLTVDAPDCVKNTSCLK